MLDDGTKRCKVCGLVLINCRQKKNHMFLSHYQQNQQIGGSLMNQQQPFNVLKRGPITYYSVNFYQHKYFYNFFDEGVIDSLFDSMKDSTVSPKNEFKMQGYAEIVNFQPTETIELENLRLWVTNVYYGRYFNNVARQKMKQDILKRVIIKGETGSSWHFKHFNKI